MTLFRKLFKMLPDNLKKGLKDSAYPVIERLHARIKNEGYLRESIKENSEGLNLEHYQLPVLQRLIDLGGFNTLQGRRVCEIGGDGEFGIARLWHRLTGERVVVSNPYPNTALTDEALSQYGVSLVRLPFESMTSASNAFDIIYGCAVMEHIVNMAEFFECAFERLAPGGWAILHGCPLWHSAVGHHTYILCDDTLYSFGDENCPVRPFSHLYMMKDELREALVKRSVPQKHADAICSQIYDSDQINRLSIAQICSAAAKQPWQEIRLVTDIDYTPHQQKDFINKLGIEVKDVQRAAIYIAVKKPDYL